MKKLFCAVFAVLFVFFGCSSTQKTSQLDFSVAVAQSRSEGLDQLMHLRLSEYTDMSRHTRFSHACKLEIGNERYAGIGTLEGTVVLRYTNYVSGEYVNSVDSQDVTFFPGAKSVWRECRSRVDENGVGWIYVVTEGQDAGVSLTDNLPGGLQIIRVEPGSQPVLANTYVGLFNTAHTIFIKDNLAFVNGSAWRTSPDHFVQPPSRASIGGMRILDISDPENPRDLGAFSDSRMYGNKYTHDSYALGNVSIDGSFYSIVYSADIYNGWVRALDAKDPSNIVVLDSVRTPLAEQYFDPASPLYPQRRRKAYTHNMWASEDNKWLFATEELKGSSLNVYDISDPRHPKFVTDYRSEAVADSSIAHNVYVRGDTAYVSWYTEGVRLIDISDPAQPEEVAWFDSSDMDPNSPRGAMQGNWSVVVDSDGNILIVDMQNGFFILRPE